MKIQITSILLVALIGLSACAAPTTDDEISTAVRANNDPCVQDILNNVPKELSRCSDTTNSNSSLENTSSSFSQCSDAANFAGTRVTCVIGRAYCSYQPGTSGSPTFCNDVPYPNNKFTLIAWGEDWSDYDGKCINITGVVSIFGGKPQIEAASREQITLCQ